MFHKHNFLFKGDLLRGNLMIIMGSFCLLLHKNLCCGYSFD